MAKPGSPRAGVPDTNLLVVPHQMRCKKEAGIRPSYFAAIKTKGMSIACEKLKRDEGLEAHCSARVEWLHVKHSDKTEAEEALARLNVHGQAAKTGVGSVTSSHPLGKRETDMKRIGELRKDAADMSWKSRRQEKQTMAAHSSDIGRMKFGFGREELDEEAGAYYEGQFKLY